MSEPTQSQERVFAELIRIPGIEIESVDAWPSRCVLIDFRRVDPRPSRNGLVDDGFIGSVVIGPRGGIRGGCFAFRDYFDRRGTERIRGRRDFSWFKTKAKRRHQFFA